MKFLLPLAFSLALAAGGAAAATRDHAVSGFHGVEVSVPMDLEIVQGGAEGLRLEGDESLLARVEVVVENDVLRIRPRERYVRWKGSLRGTLNASRIRSVALAGAGKVKAAELSGDEVRASISGSGEISVGRIEGQRASFNISGSGTLRAGAGRAEALSVNISGSGDVEAPRLEAARVKVRIAGSGDATVAARESLETHIAGVGDVRYYGDPRVEKRIAGAGSVSRLGAHPG